MRAGKLTERIIIQSKQVVKDKFGSESISYTDKINTNAEIKETKLDRSIVSDIEMFGSVLTFYIRDYHKVDNTDRIQYMNNYYNILSVYLNKSRMLLEIKAQIINEI